MTTLDGYARIRSMHDIGFLFEPSSVAIVGASSDPQSNTNVNFLQPLLQFGYRGRVYPVNPSVSEIMGLQAYAGICDIPEPVDYAICAIPVTSTPQLIRECVAKKVKAVALFTAGFSETGEDEGTRIEKEVVEIARRGGVRVLGPNCMGIHCPKAGLSLDASIPRESGHVSFLSQSGGNSQDIILGLAERRVFMSKLVSYGNAADLNEADFLEYFADDGDTCIIGAYVEGVKQPQRFLRVLREAVRSKPVIVVKGGTTEAGSGAVSLHTGALAGSTATWDAFCKQAGVIQGRDLGEMTDAIQAFSHLKPPRGRRVGIVGVGGGANVLAADECESTGLVVPVLPTDVRGELRMFTPAAGTGLRNPVDTLTSIYLEPDVLARTVRVVAGWDGVDFLFVVFPTLLGVRLGVQCLKDGVEAVVDVAKSIDKPLAFILRTANCAEGESIAWDVQGQCCASGFPVFWSPAEAARAMDHLITYYENRLAWNAFEPA